MTTRILDDKRVHGLLKRIEAWVQEELGAKQRLLTALAEQEAALNAADPDVLATATAVVAQQVQAEQPRGAQLALLLDELGSHWQVDPVGLTLGGISERAGAQVPNLPKLRAQLRAACEEATRIGRRIALIAGTQREVLAEVLGWIAGDGETGPSSGRLVDAEA